MGNEAGWRYEKNGYSRMLLYGSICREQESQPRANESSVCVLRFKWKRGGCRTSAWQCVLLGFLVLPTLDSFLAI